MNLQQALEQRDMMRASADSWRARASVAEAQVKRLQSDETWERIEQVIWDTATKPVADVVDAIRAALAPDMETSR